MPKRSVLEVTTAAREHIQQCPIGFIRDSGGVYHIITPGGFKGVQFAEWIATLNKMLDELENMSGNVMEDEVPKKESKRKKKSVVERAEDSIDFSEGFPSDNRL